MNKDFWLIVTTNGTTAINNQTAEAIVNWLDTTDSPTFRYISLAGADCTITRSGIVEIHQSTELIRAAIREHNKMIDDEEKLEKLLEGY